MEYQMYQCLLVIGSQVKIQELYEITLKFYFFIYSFTKKYTDVLSLLMIPFDLYCAKNEGNCGFGHIY